uniref:RING-type domain-containing protein n=1 Tax=Ascaris lumbricoides TaxID=6252 RepID=A0A9J2Q7I3_ASCLU
MSEVAPIIIRLEVEKNAPFIKFEFSGTDEEVLVRPSGSKTMSSKRRNKKVVPVSRTEDCADALPPVAADTAPRDTERVAPDQLQCVGRRKYAEVVVETFTEENVSKTTARETNSEPPQGCSLQPTASVLSLSPKAASEPPDLEKMSYFSGNPFVEKTSGLLHFYKHSESGLVQNAKCSMLCMLNVPSLITCRELLKFVSPCLQSISAMKIIRDMTPNQYMVILKFKSHEATVSFYRECNDTRFNQIEPERCSLVFVERIESTREEAGGSLPVDSLTELPTCAVCLERMDDGVLTILCNHTFHANCLEQWADTTCPVCRHGQTPEITPDQKCFDCGKTTDLWICLICGNIGCGRYAEAHAYRHFEATSHTFTLQIGGERVWDYAGDNYVHRLIQSATDGKMVEFQRDGANQTDVLGDEKMEAIQLEYTCLLTSQLEKQRIYFENKLAEAERRFGKLEKMAQAQMDELEGQVKQTTAECEKLKKELSASEHQRQALEKKHQNAQHKLNKALGELSEERAINKLLRDDQNKWTEKVNNLEQKNDALHEKFTATVNELNEQVRDLMMHFEAQNKFKETVDNEDITQKELQEGTVVLGETQHSPNKGRRRTKK